MDVLSDVLRVARLKGGVFLHAEFSAPWCIAAQVTPDVCAPFMERVSHVIPYHYVVTGEMLVSSGVAGTAPVRLRAGELVLFPHNDLHVMGSTISRHPVSADEIISPPSDQGLFSIRHGGGGENVRLVCGFLGCDHAEMNPVLSTLPRMLVLDGDPGGGDEWIRSTFKFAADEVATGRPGSTAVLGKLSELLFVEAVRRYAEALPEGQTGWLAGLGDQYVARALALFHADVARDWSNDSLAAAVGLSRSALADRFSRLIGMAPIHYLAHWRMQVAAQELCNSSASLAQIAHSVGYESEASFSRAFKKVFGTAPASWRRDSIGNDRA
ncbi:MAG TPA: AraC family transcriptional regulator [Sphingomonadaceae bacterium]|nr:AraC family transcriptional regulator [Sphingomonadaceae bacterium]